MSVATAMRSYAVQRLQGEIYMLQQRELRLRARIDREQDKRDALERQYALQRSRDFELHYMEKARLQRTLDLLNGELLNARNERGHWKRAAVRARKSRALWRHRALRAAKERASTEVPAPPAPSPLQEDKEVG